MVCGKEAYFISVRRWRRVGLSVQSFPQASAFPIYANVQNPRPRLYRGILFCVNVSGWGGVEDVVWG